MKRIVLIVSMLFGLVGFGLAQTAPQKDTKKAKTTTSSKAATTASTAKTATTVSTAKPAAGPTKKDGTPDMRYKANKEAAKKPPVHTKKDGTPDMRYKENKKTPATTPKKAS